MCRARVVAGGADIRRSFGLRAIGLAVLIIGVPLAGYLLWHSMQAPSVTENAQLLAVPLTTYPGSETSASFSPDGNQIAFVWDGETQANSNIYLKLVGPGTPIRLTEPARGRVSAMVTGWQADRVRPSAPIRSACS